MTDTTDPLSSNGMLSQPSTLMPSSAPESLRVRFAKDADGSVLVRRHLLRSSHYKPGRKSTPQHVRRRKAPTDIGGVVVGRSTSADDFSSRREGVPDGHLILKEPSSNHTGGVSPVPSSTAPLRGLSTEKGGWPSNLSQARDRAEFRGPRLSLSVPSQESGIVQRRSTAAQSRTERHPR